MTDWTTFGYLEMSRKVMGLTFRFWGKTALKNKIKATMGDKNKIGFMIPSHESCLFNPTATHGFSHLILTTTLR